MEIKVAELKTKIQEGSIGNSLILLVYSGTTFLANQYVNQIALVRNKTRVYVDGLEDIRTSNNFFNSDEDSSLYILNVDNFESSVTDFSQYKNTIVITKKVSDETKQAVKMTAVYSKLPELKDWQILEYMKSISGGLKDEQLKYLYDIAKGDIYRLNNEISKIALFDETMQSNMFYLIKKGGDYSDTTSFDVYQLKDALFNKDTKKLVSILLELKNMDIDFMGLLSVLHRNLKDIITVVLSKERNPEKLNMKESQFRVILSKYGNFDVNKICNLLDFITSIDYKLKSGLLSSSDSRLIDYLICNMLTIS
jgi:DNA polymerase III delta subunit